MLQAAHGQAVFDGTRLRLPVVSAGAERYAAELVLVDAANLVFRLDPASLGTLTGGSATQAIDPSYADGVLNVPLVRVGNDNFAAALDLVTPADFTFKVNPASIRRSGSRTPEPFRKDARIVSTSFFHWFAANGGQRSGPWQPVEGRQNWEGTPTWWQSQIKQVMSANIDVINVHLIPTTEERRITLFQGLKAMLDAGYDIPNVAPFLDPLITWSGQPKVDLATAAGKKAVADQYVRFYTQYFQYVAHPDAASHLATIDGRPVLTTWHFAVNMSNIPAMTRDDLFVPLRDAFAARSAVFAQPPYMVTTALNPPVVSFSDERVATFEINQYYHEVTHNGVTSVQLKPGYWDQNVRTPGSFLPRAGGTHYAQAWSQVHAGVQRVYVESWNEYDEGTGIYAGAVTAPFIAPGSQNPNTDTWSASGDPFEYIRTTARGAARFNNRPALDALVLSHTLPARMSPGASIDAEVTLRNQGNESWTGAAGFRLAQQASDPVRFSAGAPVVDTDDEIPLDGGIFRGRPVRFKLRLTAPDTPGRYLVRWQMNKGAQPFGETVATAIEVR
ncbi:MAG: NBR1-Ig-like domain-containing protein [Rubrivivax sp.]